MVGVDEQLLDGQPEREPETSTSNAQPATSRHDEEPPFGLRNEIRFFLHKGIPLVIYDSRTGMWPQRFLTFITLGRDSPRCWKPVCLPFSTC